MAHHRKAVAAAAALNSGIFVVEAVAGYQAGSLALIMDSVHNLSDEMGLVLLYLAFVLPLGVSRRHSRLPRARRERPSGNRADQRQEFAPFHSITSSAATSRRNRQAKRLRGFEVKYRFVLGRSLHRKVCRFRAA